ncbi:protein gustavus-like [Armigeres subalbatus]|uniref:protein gustavus-like n=1 Tax=Armigeres subalbatus TaxID=124917 RepID=UPI002ED5E135
MAHNSAHGTRRLTVLRDPPGPVLRSSDRRHPQSLSPSTSTLLPRVVLNRIDPHEFERIRVSYKVAIRSTRCSRTNSGAHPGMNMGKKISGGVKTVSSRDQPSPFIPKIPRELAAHFQRPARLDLLLDMPPAARETPIKYSWNSEDRSLNVFVKEDDKMTFHRHPVAQSTDCIRGKVGFTKGLHVWEVFWSTRQRGTHAVIGVATSEAPLHSVGYQSLVCSNDHSWGWDLGRNMLYHNSKTCTGVTYPAILKPDETFLVQDKFLVALDMDEGTLSFIVDGQYLGVAFRGLKGRKLYLPDRVRSLGALRNHHEVHRWPRSFIVFLQSTIDEFSSNLINQSCNQSIYEVEAIRHFECNHRCSGSTHQRFKSPYKL